MSLAQKETSEEVMNWLLDNEALEFTPEYDLKAQLYLNLKDEAIKPAEDKEELMDWLLDNEDKEGTAEYSRKANQYQKAADKVTANTSGAAAYGRGVVQGATFELYDEAKSAALAAADYFTNNPSESDFAELYASRKETEDKLLRSYKENSGGAYLGGQVSGSVATMPLGGLFGKAGQLLFGVGGRGATLGQTAGKAAQAGAAQAGLAGFGAGDGVEDSFKGAALGVGVGGVLGGSLAAGGYKLAERIANSSTGLLNKAADVGAVPRSTVELTEDLVPQLTSVATKAKAARDAAYNNWRVKLDNLITKREKKTGQRVTRDETEEGAAQVIPTGALKAMISGMQSLVTDQKNINGILQESNIVSVDTYRNLVKTAWDLQKQLPPNKAVPFAKKLADIKGFEYRHLDSVFPGAGAARKKIDNSVASYETGQLLNDQIVTKIARGEALEPTFAKQFLPNNSASFNNFKNLKTRVESWAKEANMSPKDVDEILAPLRANALSDLINTPKLLSALGKKETSEQLTLNQHYKELLTPEQFSFVSKIKALPEGSLQRRASSLLDYYASTAVLGTLGVGGAGVVAGGPAGLAVLGIYLASPLLMNSVAKNKQVFALASKILTASGDTPPKELMKMTNILGKAALKAGIITPSTAITTLSNMQQSQQQ